jgi:hypothetical protein
MLKYDNHVARGAGSGIIPAGAKPMKRGVWDVYETTHPFIGLFDRCFWIEFNDDHQYDSRLREEALEDLSYFFDENMKDNLIMLEFSNMRIMGGIANISGKSRAGIVYREEKERNKKHKPKFPDTPLVYGYELRFCHEDAVTFATLWPGYEAKPEK